MADIHHICMKCAMELGNKSMRTLNYEQSCCHLSLVLADDQRQQAAMQIMLRLYAIYRCNRQPLADTLWFYMLVV
jgi:hypothetical protein